MSLWNDEVLAYLDNAEMTEEDALSLVYSLGRRYDWLQTVWQLSDITVLDEDGEEAEATAAMLAVVANSRAWRQGIGERIDEHVNELLPVIEVHADGSFEINGWNYTADGQKVED